MEKGHLISRNPDWMSRLPEELLDVPLWNLALPGSHDSMSFSLDVSSPVVRSESCFLRLTDRLFPCFGHVTNTEMIEPVLCVQVC
uniref:Phosphatidylinositol-specific phospholipase C X domain-containing protein n=1 Tax=Neolamprologus brichardi TaxID=32507 RepID=A0A3Q4HNT6_NEOBR